MSEKPYLLGYDYAYRSARLATAKVRADLHKRTGIVSLTPLPSHPIRIFILDSQALIATALRHLFAAHTAFEVVGTAQVAKALTLRSVKPDVILISQQHGTTEICDLVSTCRTAAPASKICVVACHTHPELFPRVMDAGADAYAIKDMAPNEFIDAIVAVHRGSNYVDPRLEPYHGPASNPARRVRSLNALSMRETEVLKLIADGYSNREISIALSLSEKTIKNHISRIFAKLHITARTQAVIHAIKSGIA